MTTTIVKKEFVVNTTVTIDAFDAARVREIAVNLGIPTAQWVVSKIVPGLGLRERVDLVNRLLQEVNSDEQQ